jgi:hypothetical protein
MELVLLYQGTTSVVPKRLQNERGFSRCGFWNFW